MPEGLCTLTFGYDFEHGLDHVILPKGLQSLTLSRSYSCSLKNVTFPAGLDTIELGHLCDGVLPSGLQTLICGHRFNQSHTIVFGPEWPPGFKAP